MRNSQKIKIKILPKLFKWQFFTFWNQPKLISRKISGMKIAKFPHCVWHVLTWSLVFYCVLASFFPTKPQWGQLISTHRWGLWRDLRWPYQRSSNAHWPIGWMCFVGCVSIRRQPADKTNHFHHHYGQSLLSWQLNNINDLSERPSKYVINDITYRCVFSKRHIFSQDVDHIWIFPPKGSHQITWK